MEKMEEYLTLLDLDKKLMNLRYNSLNLNNLYALRTEVAFRKNLLECEDDE